MLKVSMFSVLLLLIEIQSMFFAMQMVQHIHCIGSNSHCLKDGIANFAIPSFCGCAIPAGGTPEKKPSADLKGFDA